MKYINYYPNILSEIYEFKQLSVAMDTIFNELHKNINLIIDELFILTAQNYGLKKWEDALDIPISQNDTIDIRRFRILTRINGDNSNIIDKLDYLLGKENYTIRIDPVSCKIDIVIKLVSKKHLIAVSDLLDKILPANIEYNVILALNTHTTLSKYSHKELGKYSHKQLSEEVLD